MSIPRDINIEREKIVEQFQNCAMHHATFLHKPELERSDKIGIEKLADLYTAYRHTTNLHELEQAGRNIIVPSVTDWRAKTPFERYEMVNRERAMSQGAFVNNFFKQQGLSIPGENRLDIGAGSCLFMDYMNHLERQSNSSKHWFGVDVPDEARAKITDGSDLDRRAIGPDFKEYPVGAPMPFKDKKFGLATMFYTLHHVDKEHLKPGIDTSVLSQAYDRLEPGGYLLILEDNIGEDAIDPIKYSFVKQQDKLFYPNSPGDQRTMDEWSRLLMQHGFEVIRHGDVSMYNSIGIMTRDAIILARKPL